MNSLSDASVSFQKKKKRLQQTVASTMSDEGTPPGHLTIFDGGDHAGPDPLLHSPR